MSSGHESGPSGGFPLIEEFNQAMEPVWNFLFQPFALFMYAIINFFDMDSAPAH